MASGNFHHLVVSAVLAYVAPQKIAVSLCYCRGLNVEAGLRSGDPAQLSPRGARLPHSISSIFHFLVVTAAPSCVAPLKMHVITDMSTAIRAANVVICIPFAY
jgi:hypothetical protein